MALTNNDRKILQEIVSLEGKCMESARCINCPFRGMCLPDFLNPVPPTTTQREKMAGDILTHDSLLGEDVEISDYKWDKR